MSNQPNLRHEAEQEAFRDGIAEAEAWLADSLASATDFRGQIDALNRATRSQLVSRRLHTPDDIEGVHTNCFGAVLHLQAQASRFGIDVAPALMLRQPWQAEESCREIHLLAVAFGPQGEIIVTDPMPEAGYSYGTTKVGRRSSASPDVVLIDDDELGGQSAHLLLTTEDFAAIRAVYELETSPSGMPIATDTIATLFAALRRAPSYQARLVHVLTQRGVDIPDGVSFDEISPHAVRRRYIDYISGPNRVIGEHDLALEDARKRQLLSRASWAAAQASDVYQRGYWLSVVKQFGGQLPETDPGLRKLTPHDYAASGSRSPIRDYEDYMYAVAPWLAVSNMYAPNGS